jgi:hypothetical protein
MSWKLPLVKPNRIDILYLLRFTRVQQEEVHIPKPVVSLRTPPITQDLKNIRILEREKCLNNNTLLANPR